MKTENLAIKDIENLFHPATNLVVHEDSEPLILNKGEGIYVYDIHGNKYIEGWLAFGAMHWVLAMRA
jgi:adenosylmethionine-8-amino-7-oxononanoate aminotransferase